MTTAVASSSGTSEVQGISLAGYGVGWFQVRLPYAQEHGYEVCWVQARYPHETGYQVAWIGIRLPYVVASIVFLPGGHGVSRGARSKRPIVDDRNDLQDLCEIWELMMRKAA